MSTHSKPWLLPDNVLRAATRLPPQIRNAAAAKMVWDVLVKANAVLWIKRQLLNKAALQAQYAYAGANSLYEKVCTEVSQTAHECDTVRC